MARLKILLVTLSVLTLFVICGGCEREGRERRDDDGWQNRQSERERSDRDRDKSSEAPREERHEEQH
jgi:hypothetical protein